MTRAIRVGVQLPEVEREVRWPEVLDMARAIDDLGFDAALGRRAPALPLARSPGSRPMGGVDADGRARGGRRRGSRSVRSSPAPGSITRRCSRSRRRRSTRSPAGGSSWGSALAGTKRSSGRLASRSKDASPGSRRRSRSSGRSSRRVRSTSTAGSTRPATASSCRGRRPGGPPLLIGSNGPRMLRIALPHVQAWNTWYADTDNSPVGRRSAGSDRRRGVPRRGP